MDKELFEDVKNIPIKCETQCPFCGEKEFDMHGLKYHIENHCEVYPDAEEINGKL